VDVDPIKAAIPLWYAQLAWAKELIARGFNLARADDILRPEHRGCRRVPGTEWFIRTHGVGVDVYRTPDVGGIDFDFDKPHPDAWRLKNFIERQVNDGSLPYEPYRELLDDEELLQKAVIEAVGRNT
jgi:hypothetical protein